LSFYFSRIVVDPKIFVKGGLSSGGNEILLKFRNMHADIHDITFDIHDSNRMYCGTDGEYIEAGMEELLWKWLVTGFLNFIM
jgi:hypothetical protein